MRCQVSNESGYPAMSAMHGTADPLCRWARGSRCSPVVPTGVSAIALTDFCVSSRARRDCWRHHATCKPRQLTSPRVHKTLAARSAKSQDTAPQSLVRLAENAESAAWFPRAIVRARSVRELGEQSHCPLLDSDNSEVNAYSGPDPNASSSMMTRDGGPSQGRI